MSEEQTILKTEDGQMLTAEYRDGHLQIVEVSPYDKVETHILPDSISESNEPKFIQVLDSSGKGLMQLDLLNFTLVKCEGGDESYQMVGSSSDDGGETTLTCVLANDDEETQDASSYVLLESVQESEEKHDPENSSTTKNTTKEPLTPVEILEKAKALQKTKAILNAQMPNRRGRKRKSALPAPMELLASPNFKLYLYSCKMCHFKCNAIKDMSVHKALEHGPGGAGRKTEGPRSRAAGLQCAQCPFRAAVHTQLMKHVNEVHVAPSTKEKFILLDLDKKEEEGSDGSVAVELLVCGACGFECRARAAFALHARTVHAVSVADLDNILSGEEQSEIN